MLGTGVRVGEACALTWERIDLEAGTLRVEATSVDGPSDKRGVQQALKTDRSRRTLFLPDFVVVSLVEHGPREAGPVLVTRAGACMSPANLRRSLCTAVAEANLDFRVTFHTLRRTLATFLAREIGTREAADQLGHTDPVVALSHYIAPEHRGSDARAAISNFIQGPSTAPSYPQDVRFPPVSRVVSAGFGVRVDARFQREVVAICDGGH